MFHKDWIIPRALASRQSSNIVKFSAYRNSGTLDTSVGRLTLGAALWKLVSRYWTLFLIGLEQNQNPVSDSAWLNY